MISVSVAGSLADNEEKDVFGESVEAEEEERVTGSFGKAVPSIETLWGGEKVG